MSNRIKRSPLMKLILKSCLIKTKPAYWRDGQINPASGSIRTVKVPSFESERLFLYGNTNSSSPQVLCNPSAPMEPHDSSVRVDGYHSAAD